MTGRARSTRRAVRRTVGGSASPIPSCSPSALPSSPVLRESLPVNFLMDQIMCRASGSRGLMSGNFAPMRATISSAVGSGISTMVHAALALSCILER